jgi:CspA family cold shock protein
MSNQNPVRPQDQICYCDRCGISFLWSTEEQHAQAQVGATLSTPTHCAGCRQLLPAAGRERGLVKWYNFRKRYGFLVRKEHPEIFAHGSEIEPTGAAGHGLRPGDLVEFTVGQSARGPVATAIRVIDQSEPPVAD